MHYILPILILAALVLGWRVYTISTYFRKNSDPKKRLAIQLPTSFYINQLIALLALGLFFFALDPVPAGFAIAGAFGVMLEILLSVFTYSIRAVDRS